MRVDISFAVQYWGAGEGWSERLAGWVAPMLPQLHLAAATAQLSAEVLVNSDSRHVRGGDAAYLVAALGEADSLLLSPATHELRAYNRLAIGLSRGRFVIFVQDDTRPPPPSAGGLLDVRWLTRSLALFLRWPQVGSISLNAGLFFVSNYSEAQVGVQVMDDLPGAARQPACEAEGDRAPGEAAARMVPGVEAIRCADVGPLLVRRAHFLEVGAISPYVSLYLSYISHTSPLPRGGRLQRERHGARRAGLGQRRLRAAGAPVAARARHPRQRPGGRAAVGAPAAAPRVGTPSHARGARTADDQLLQALRGGRQRRAPRD